MAAVVPIYFGSMESSLKATMIFPWEPERARVLAAWLIVRRIAVARELGTAIDGALADEAAKQVFLDVACAGSDFAYIYSDALRNADDGARAGLVVVCLFALICSEPQKASWEAAIEAAEAYMARYNRTHGVDLPSTRTQFRDCLNHFKPVLHLLGARTIRRRDASAGLDRIIDLVADPKAGYSTKIDLLFFAEEARQLQCSLGVWNSRRQPSQRSELFGEMLELIDCWVPPPQQPEWPNTGRIKGLALDPWIEIVRKRPGRPKLVSK